jgi:AbrB family looped-hinge helix DNA binding protein
MTEIDLVKVGEKGQIVIPKKMREDLKIEKGTRLIITEEGSKITIKKAALEEDQLWMLAGEETLKKTWDNKHDERWNDAL